MMTSHCTHLFSLCVLQNLPLFEPMSSLDDSDSLESSLADVGFSTMMTSCEDAVAGGVVGGVVMEDPWPELSDSSDSGIDCTYPWRTASSVRTPVAWRRVYVPLSHCIECACVRTPGARRRVRVPLYVALSHDGNYAVSFASPSIS